MINEDRGYDDRGPPPGFDDRYDPFPPPPRYDERMDGLDEDERRYGRYDERRGYDDRGFYRGDSPADATRARGGRGRTRMLGLAAKLVGGPSASFARR